MTMLSYSPPGYHQAPGTRPAMAWLRRPAPPRLFHWPRLSFAEQDAATELMLRALEPPGRRVRGGGGGGCHGIVGLGAWWPQAAGWEPVRQQALLAIALYWKAGGPERDGKTVVVSMAGYVDTWKGFLEARRPSVPVGQLPLSVASAICREMQVTGQFLTQTSDLDVQHVALCFAAELAAVNRAAPALAPHVLRTMQGQGSPLLMADAWWM
eukprot:Skav226237  [mRNA]  locus=scaffold1218:432713:442307:- [translate_table: standard]